MDTALLVMTWVLVTYFSIGAVSGTVSVSYYRCVFKGNGKAWHFAHIRAGEYLREFERRRAKSYRKVFINTLMRWPQQLYNLVWPDGFPSIRFRMKARS